MPGVLHVACTAAAAVDTVRCAGVRASRQADEPLSASIPLLSETGPLSLPFAALARQAAPSIAPGPCVSCDGTAGGVMLGAASSTAVTITNAGVLDVVYDVRVRVPWLGVR